MYNHFATMVSLRPMPMDNMVTLNREVEEFNQPWWLNTTETMEKSKANKPKKEMNKEERQQYNKEVTFEYLKNANYDGQMLTCIWLDARPAVSLHDCLESVPYLEVITLGSAWIPPPFF